MKETRAPNFEAYLLALREQVKQHTRDKITCADSVKTLSIGFSSPDGRWCIGINKITAWATDWILGRDRDRSWQEVPTDMPKVKHLSRGGSVSKEKVARLAGIATNLAMLGEDYRDHMKKEKVSNS